MESLILFLVSMVVGFLATQAVIAAMRMIKGDPYWPFGDDSYPKR